MNKTGLLISAGLLLAYVWKQKKRATDDDESRLPNVDPGSGGDYDPDSKAWESRSQLPSGVQITPWLKVRNIKSRTVEVLPMVYFKNYSDRPIYIYGIEGDFGLWGNYPIFDHGNRQPIRFTSNKKPLLTIESYKDYLYSFEDWGWLGLERSQTDQLSTVAGSQYVQDFAKTTLAFWYDYKPEQDGVPSKKMLYQAICRDYKTRIIK
jgi:hypothetical protein